MSINCSDVNVIFALVSIRHKFHYIVADHIDSIKNQKYVLLKHVKNTFIYTYNDNLNKVGDIIISTVNRVKEILGKRRLKSPPSDIVKNAYLKKEMEELLKAQSGKKLSPSDYDYYKNILLNEFPLIELLNNEEKLVEFDSTYVEKAKEIVDDKLQEFISTFTNIENSPKLNQANVKEWNKTLKEIKINNLLIFTGPDDEDIRLSSEYLTYCQDRRTALNLLSTDKNLSDSLKFVIKEKNLKCGEIHFLLSKQ